MFLPLKDRVAFDRPVTSPDGAGGTLAGWVKVHECGAEFIYSRGSEAVDAARLQGRAIYKIRLRSTSTTRDLTTDHRMRDLRRGAQDGEFPGVAYQVREVDPITDRRWVFLVVESGVAV